MDVITVEELQAALAEVLPVRGGALGLSGGEPLVREGSGGDLLLKLVLTRWTVDGAGQPVAAHTAANKVFAFMHRDRQLDVPLGPYLRVWAKLAEAALATGSSQLETADQLLDDGVFRLMKAVPLEGFEQALRGEWSWILPPPPPPPPRPSPFPQTSPRWLRDLLGGLFPVSSPDGRLSLELVDATERDEGPSLVGVFQLFVRADGQIRDIKEQEVDLLGPAHRADAARAAAFFTAWARLLPDHLARVEDADTLLPHDLYPRKVLAQRSPATEDDFLHALHRHWKLGVPR
jgi:hypothetical protein